VVYVDDAIGKRCVKPKIRGLAMREGAPGLMTSQRNKRKAQVFFRGYLLQFV
jgi:hypothetical protein